MRLITRSDFDGLACGALLKEAGIIDSWKFAHPKDLQDGLVEVNENDCLVRILPTIRKLWVELIQDLQRQTQQPASNFIIISVKLKIIYFLMET